MHQIQVFMRLMHIHKIHFLDQKIHGEFAAALIIHVPFWISSTAVLYTGNAARVYKYLEERGYIIMNISERRSAAKSNK